MDVEHRTELARELLSRGIEPPDAHTFEGLLTRTAAVLAAHTLLLTQLGNTM